MTTAVLAMYPLPALRPAWEQLWRAVHDRTPWTPPTLRWTDDVVATWHDPECVVSHACGWPVATSLRDVVDVVGAFSLALPDVEGHRYRTVIMASTDERPAPDVTAVVNADDSLSGWISLRAALVGGAEWPGPVLWSGSHVASLRALQEGRAQVASIDPWTLHHVRRYQPDLAAGLHVVGAGPLVPSPPVVVPAGTPGDRIEELRAAFADALAADPELAEELAVTGFVPLDHADYEPLSDLVPTV